MKKFIVFSRSISKYSYSENWTFRKQFDDEKYAHMWVEVETNSTKDPTTLYCVAVFDLPVIPAKEDENASKLAS